MIDLFSDTVTRPTLAMKQAMMAAELGDEQKGEDPTTRKLEEMTAELLGFDAALFFPSATMANEVALKLLCDPGDELIAAEKCHLFFAEAGGPAIHAGIMCRGIQTKNGIFTGDDVQNMFRWSKGPHYPITKCVSIENTTNMGGGIAWELATIHAIVSSAKELNLKLHCDGSRLFNAVVKTNLPPHILTAGFDTVTVCLSKGLGCPIGAVLVFKKEHYEKVRRLKQLMGGALRQSGIVAAAGIYALQHHIERLADDHANASEFATKLIEEIPTITVENPEPSTNMVFFQWHGKNLTPEQFNQTCIQQGLRFSYVSENRFRAVTHLDIQRADIHKAILILKQLL